MTRSLRLTYSALDAPAQGASVPDPASRTAGAVLTFLGIVRDREGDGSISALHYEAFEAMAEYQFHKLLDQIERRWPEIESVRLVHRLGTVPVSEPSLRVDVASPHRAEAFAACQWLIDEMKRVVPIWKRPIPVSPDEIPQPSQACPPEQPAGTHPSKPSGTSDVPAFRAKNTH